MSRYKRTLQEIINKCNIKHNNKYDYSLITEYLGSKHKYKIICPKHGMFEITLENHLHGNGCKKCQYEKLHFKNSDSLDDFIKKAQIIHGNKYDYSQAKYYNSHTNIKIICQKHGVFFQKPYKHLQGQGCPKCKNYHLEIIIEKILKELKIEYIHQYSFYYFLWDFYLPKYKLIIDDVPVGFEPTLNTLEGYCFIQLSYRDLKR